MLLVLLLFQGVRYLLLTLPPKGADESLLATPGVLIWVDSLRGIAQTEEYNYLYNPNTLGDYQGYMLGLRPKEIDCLLIHRIQGHRIKNRKDFQRVTGISEAMMQQISPRLRFETQRPYKRKDPSGKRTIAEPVVKDLNAASATDLQAIRGVGPVLGERIVKFRDRFNGFQVNAQLYHVYGLDTAVADRILERYRVLHLPEVKTIDINRATVEELTELVYFNWALARRIIAYRERHGPFQNLDELTKIQDFPKDKIDQIKLYLSL